MSPIKFTISGSFDAKTRKLLEEAVPDTDLPEGVNVVRAGENAEKPFVVISASYSTQEALKAFRKGALRFAPLVADADVLREKLSSHKEKE